MPNLLTKVKSQIFYDVVDGKKMYAGGLEPHVESEKDFKIGIFGFGEYTPKNDDLTIDTPDILQFRNTCTMASSVGQKQSDEKVPLNIRLHVANMRSLGLLSGDGFSSLRSNQETIQKFGVPEHAYADENFDDDNWERYSTFPWTDGITANALTHKSASFWATQNKNEILKLLDEGRVAQTGMEWWSGFNMRGGLTAPWIINKTSGYLVGGHAFRCNGYVKNYQGRGLHLRFKNSYGAGYGDKGHFYMPIDYALSVCYTFYFQLDIDVDVGKFLQKYEGKYVKQADEKIGDKIITHPGIYRIKNGVAEPFPDMETFFIWGGVRKGYEVISDPTEVSQLLQVPPGSVLEAQYSPYWPLVKNITNNLTELVRVVNQAIEFEKNFN